MPGSLHRLVVLDLTHTSWEGSPPPGEEEEIVELAAVDVDLVTLEVSPPEALLVRPSVSRPGADFEDRTGLGAERLTGGVAWIDAAEWLRKERGTGQYPVATWSSEVASRIRRAGRGQPVRPPLPEELLTIAPLVAASGGWRSVPGRVEAAERILGGYAAASPGSRPGNPDRAGDRVWNAARILARCLEAIRAGTVRGG